MTLRIPLFPSIILFNMTVFFNFQLFLLVKRLMEW